MKKTTVLGNILFWLTLISPIVSFSLSSIIGEANIFGVAGIVRYSWLMWLFVPIGILSILIGLKLKISNQNFKKNLVVAFICLPLLMIFGSYRFVFNNISYDADRISTIGEEINIKLPDEIRVATIKSDLYDVSYVKIVNEEQKKAFEQEIKNNHLWQERLKLEIKCILPLDVQYEVEIFDCFMFYNITSNEYNKCPLDEDIQYVFIAYNYDTQKLIIIENKVFVANLTD